MGKDPPRPTDGEFYEAQQVKVFFADQWHEGRVVAMSGIGRVRVHFDDKEYEMATSDVRSCQQNAASKKISDSTARGHGAESSTQKKGFAYDDNSRNENRGMVLGQVVRRFC